MEMETGDEDPIGGMDRISGLPDDLLHNILLRLGSTTAAARTGVLSRRWRSLWTRLPDFYLWHLRPILPASCVTIVDGALAACSAPTLRRLVIHVHDVNLLREGVTAAHVAPWLRFAADRAAGELFLWLPVEPSASGRKEQDLDLPVCPATRSIQIRLRRHFRLRPPVAGGAFAALTCLRIYHGEMDGRELGSLVSSSQCPCLEELCLTVTLAAESDVAICSDSLKRLRFHVENTRRLDVAAPVLLDIHVSKTVEAHIAAPQLAEVELGDEDTDQYKFAEAGRHLQRLVVNVRFPVPAILRRFDTIRELTINRLTVERGKKGYCTFMKDLRRLDCEVLVVRPLWWTCHRTLPTLLHLLRICNGLRKFVVNLSCSEGSFGCASDCPCTWSESCRTDNFVLDSLEEIEINGFTGKDHQLECLNILCRCNAPFLKQVVFRLSRRDFLKCTNIIQEKIRGVLPQGIELQACES